MEVFVVEMPMIIIIGISSSYEVFPTEIKSW